MAVRWQKITMSHSYVLIYVDPRDGSQKEMRTEAIEAITSILNDLIGEQDIRQQNNTDTNTNSTISFQKELSIFVINIVFK